MNKKLVLSVLSTAVVASMASAAMAKPPGPGFLVGGDVDKYYSLEAFLDTHFDEALDGILENIQDTYYVTPDRNIVGFIDAVYAKTADELKAKEVTPTKAHFGDNVYAIVGGEEGEVWDPATDPDIVPGVPVEFVVESVSAIETTYVEVTFAALPEALEGVTVEVKDSKGNIVEVQPTNIAKGATFAQFDFVKAITADDQQGVWTVAGVEYSFVAKEQLEKIIATAGGSNDVAFRDALDAAGIANVNNQYLADYKAVITASATAPKSLSDVQKIVDDVNAKNTNTEVVVKPVLDAKNQIDLLSALEANFARVNREWIVEYITDGSAPGIEIVNAPAANKVYTAAGTEANPVTVDGIQAAIDEVNKAQIAAADAAVTGANLKASEQAKVTALIQKYVKDDEGTSKVKATAIKESQVKEAVLRVREAGTQNSVYTALVNLSNLDSDKLKASQLNSKLVAFYRTEQQKSTTQDALAAKDTDSVITSVVQPADAAALVDALDEVVAKYTALNADDTNATKKAEFKASLQKLADYTSHTADKFDFSKVNDANLVKYAAAFAEATAIDNNSTVADVTNKIKSVNDGVVLDSALETINDAKSSATQVRDALLEIAVASDTAEGRDFINLPAQAKLEVAELLIEERPSAGFNDRAEIIDPADGTGALTDAVVAHSTRVGFFNAIGDLATATTDKILDALADYEYENFDNLSTVKKIAVAEEIAKLTKKDSDGKDVPLNFSGADAVKTFAQANAIIDTAIASAN